MDTQEPTAEPVKIEFSINGSHPPTIDANSDGWDRAFNWQMLLEALAKEIEQSGTRDRSLSLARTHVQDASNWLSRYMRESTPKSSPGVTE